MRRPRQPHTGPWGYPRILAVSLVCGLIAAALVSGRISLLPPKLKSGELQTAVAATHVFIDTDDPSIVNRDNYPVASLVRRGDLLAEVLTSRPVIDDVAHKLGVPAGQIGSSTRTTTNVPVDLTQPASEERASQITRSRLPFDVQAQSRQNTPIIDIYTRAPTTTQAVGLANAAVTALTHRLGTLADEQAIPATQRMRLRQLGTTHGAVVGGSMM